MEDLLADPDNKEWLSISTELCGGFFSALCYVILCFMIMISKFLCIYQVHIFELGRNPLYQHLVLLCLWSDLNYICSGRICIVNLNFFFVEKCSVGAVLN